MQAFNSARKKPPARVTIPSEAKLLIVPERGASSLRIVGHSKRHKTSKKVRTRLYYLRGVR